MKVAVLALLAVAVPAVAGPPRTDVHGDPLPDGALARLGTLRYRIGSAGAVALSPDGKTLAADDGYELTFWDVDTGRARLRTPLPVEGRAVQLVFSPDGRQLARFDGSSVHAFDPETGRSRAVVEWGGKMHGVGFLPGTGELAVSVDQGDVVLFDPVDGQVAGTIRADERAYFLSPSGNVFVGSSDAEVFIHDARTGRLRCRIDLDPDRIELFRHPREQTFALSPDDRRLFAVTPAGRLLTFDAESGQALGDLDSPPGWAGDDRDARLALSPDGAVAYLARWGQPTQRRDLKGNRWLDPLPAMWGGTFLPHPDGRRLLLAGTDGVLHRYDLATRRETETPLGFDDDLEVAVAPDGRRVAVRSAGWGGRLDLFDLDGKVLWSAPLGGWHGEPRWSADGRRLATAGGREAVVRDAATGKALHTLRSPDTELEFTGLVAFDPTGDHLLASLHHGEALAVFDLKAGGPPALVRPGLTAATDVSPDGRSVLFHRGGPGIALYDLEFGRLRVAWTDPVPEPRRRGCGGGVVGRDGGGPRFSPDGSYLLTWTDDGHAIVWDPVLGEPRQAIPTGKTGITASGVSADGLWLAVGTADGSVSVWDVPTGLPLVEWPAHPRAVTGVAFAGPGRLLTASRDQTALLWDLRPRKPLTRPAWDALTADDDAAEAYRAVWALAGDPAGPDLLRAKIVPAKPVAPGRVRRAIAGLGADRYAAREAAMSDIRALGRSIEADLRAARSAATSEEVRTRLEALLTTLPMERTWEEAVGSRAVAALELAGTPAARKLLAEWAAGAPGARLTMHARAALGRLEGR